MAALLLLCRCAGNGPDCGSVNELYADAGLWFDNGRDVDTTLADVFYVLPSCVYDWTDSSGVMHHNACVTDSLHRARMSRSFPVADGIFGDSANFFSPYYRQITLNAWTMDEQTRDSCLAIALNDVREAFGYYLEHWNGGRPFVLAGFSQGARCALQLLEEMDGDVSQRMVAAYIIGYHVSESELADLGWVRPAAASDDTGVCIAYNTVTDVSAKSPLINGDSSIVINPASWTLDEQPYFVNDTVCVRIDTQNHVLVAEGIDPAVYVKPRLVDMIPSGNLHLAELDLYKKQLQENVKLRIKSFAGGEHI